MKISQINFKLPTPQNYYSAMKILILFVGAYTTMFKK